MIKYDLKKLAPKTNFSIVVLSFSLFALFFLVCNLPFMGSLVIKYFPSIALKLKNIYLLAAGAGATKILIMQFLAPAFLLVNVFLFSLDIKHLTKLKCYLILAVIPLYGILLLSFQDTHRNLDYKSLVVRNYPALNFGQVFSRESLPLDKINSWNDFHLYVHNLYLKNEENLKSGWKIQDDTELKSIFLMNLVSRLWAYGDPSGTVVGCVLNNKITGETDEEDATVKTYLNSEIGCCTDYAKVLNFLLNEEGIKNRLVLINGHIFNEAYYNGHWNVLDANTNLVFHDSWENIILRKPGDKVVVTIMPHHNLLLSNKGTYRAGIGSFREEMIVFALTRKRFPLDVYTSLDTFDEP